VASPPAPPSGAALAAIATPSAPSPLGSERIYFVMPDRYANGDPSNDRGGLKGLRTVTGFDPTDTAYYHGGDLKGLTLNLRRIRDLGFTALWVTPVVKQDTWENGSAAYHGYWGVDFTTVDPHLGTDQDFADLVAAAHGLGLKVYLDVVVNHTADVVQLTNGGSYSDIPFRDCHGRFFKADRYVTAKRFPCLAARFMPEVPYVPPADRRVKKPAWLNDPLDYHDRGNIDFSSCSQQCLEQGDFYGLDDLFTEKPDVMNGLAQIYASWITRFHVDGFRVDTARHVNAAFFRLWVPKILAAARAAGVPDFQIFGEVSLGDAIDLAPYVRDRGLPAVLDFPFQDAAAGFAAGGSSALAVGNRLEDDDYFRLPDGRDPAPPTFLGNHDMGRAALQISQHGAGLGGGQLLDRVRLGYDLLYLLRGAPVVYYGDEVGMIGTGGDQQARQDMFPTQVAEWKTQARVGGPPIEDGSSFDVTTNPIETRLRELAKLRDEYPELATGATLVRYSKEKVLVVSRIDAGARRELVVGFNAGDAAARVSVPTATPGGWEPVFGTSAGIPSQASQRIPLEIPPRGAVVYRSTVRIQPTVPRVALTVAPDDLTRYLRARATVSAGAPVTVAFAVRPQGAAAWSRLAVDDSPPYRAFLDPARYPRGRQVSVVAIGRALDGTTAVSKVVTVTPRQG
jgi:glycosidase